MPLKERWERDYGQILEKEKAYSLALPVPLKKKKVGVQNRLENKVLCWLVLGFAFFFIHNLL